MKDLGLQNNRPPSSNVCLKKREDLTFDSFPIPEVFRKSYLNLVNDLAEKFPEAGNKLGLHSVEVYYKNLLRFQENKFMFQTIESSYVLKLLKNVEVNKVSGMDHISVIIFIIF